QALDSEQWQNGFSEGMQARAVRALESGQILYFPHLAFHLFAQEMPLLSTRFSTPKRKNISYHRQTDVLQGTHKINALDEEALRTFMMRYAEHARQLVENLLPHYQAALIWGRTSYRPVQISQRRTSYRKDDKRLHVDAFPASP